jgi:hypothetical protein
MRRVIYPIYTDPVWSPDGREIAFASSRGGNLDIYRKVIGASKEELVYADDDCKMPEWWLKDGTILYTTARGKDYRQIAAEGERTPKTYSTPTSAPTSRASHQTAGGSRSNSLESGRWSRLATRQCDLPTWRALSGSGKPGRLPERPFRNTHAR